MTVQKYKLTIDTLIQIVQKGGKVKTGVDIYSRDGILLLEKDVLIDSEKPLLIIKNSGLGDIEINPQAAGGLWDDSGREIPIAVSTVRPEPEKEEKPPPAFRFSRNLENRVESITKLKKEASQKYKKAKDNIKKVIDDIRESGGEFDYDMVENTVTDLFTFITRNDNAFSFLTKEIFSYDDYLYHHSINVCTIGTAILKKYNEQFGEKTGKISSLKMFQIATGFFLHDVGKVLIPDRILNKAGKLTENEFEIVKTHSFEKGMIILDKNKISQSIIRNIVKYHHGAIQQGEPNCYPEVSAPQDQPIYVKICKLADIYDAMTSKRCYKDAFNPVGVVTEIVRKYAVKDKSLGLLLHSFVKSVGIYPAGSIIQLIGGRLAYILDSDGPILIPFTDKKKRPLQGMMEPVDMRDERIKETDIAIDFNKPLVPPTKAFPLLPDNLKAVLVN